MRRVVALFSASALLASCALDRGASAGTPRYGLGRPATAQEIASVDIDVGPDGAGLPPGSGSAAHGEAVYQAKCASCHGPKGEGVPPANPPLIGGNPAGANVVFAKDPMLVRTIGNYWPRATTVFDYVRRAMPLMAPGSLTDDEVYALTAYLLAANHVIPAGATLDARSLVQVKMPNADRFVRDDRRGGREVK